MSLYTSLGFPNGDFPISGGLWAPHNKIEVVISLGSLLGPQYTEQPDEPQPWVEDFSANLRLYTGYVGVIIGIMEKKMETTIVYWNIWNSCKDAQGRVPDTGRTGHQVQLIDFGFLSPGVTQHSGP